jgi:uncharacterized protein
MELPADVTPSQILLGLYSLALLGGGIACLVILLMRASQWRAGRRAPGPWQIGYLDFGLFVCLLVFAWVFSSMLGNFVASLLLPRDFENPEYLGLLAGISALLMQGGFIALFLIWRETHRHELEGPLTPRLLGVGALLRESLFFLLAAYPLVVAASLGSRALFEALEAFGLEVDLEEQLAVELFRSIESPWLLGLFAFAAVVMAPLGEELVFRAGLYRFLLRPLGKPFAMILSSLLFGAIHLNLAGLAPLALLGIFLCVAYDLSGNIRVPIVMHMIFNAHTVGLLLFFPDALPAS